jgi:hypothetical protein
MRTMKKPTIQWTTSNGSTDGVVESRKKKSTMFLQNKDDDVLPALAESSVSIADGDSDRDESLVEQNDDNEIARSNPSHSMSCIMKDRHIRQSL